MKQQELMEREDPLEGSRLTGLHEGKRYVVSHQIAEGGMAWVYQAQEETNGTLIALKVLFPQLVADPLTRERFINEGQIQRRLQHPHLVRVFDLVDEQKLLCLALEWMDGGDLAEFIHFRGDAPFPIELIWGLFSPILQGIHCAHEEGIVHRDFKPANVMLKWEGEYLVPKLADFGIAKIREAANSKTSTGSIMGTFKYMPPEQLNDSKTADRRADLYSIGITLYRMATGRFPFEGNAESIMFKQMFVEPIRPSVVNPHVEPELDALIMKCLKKKPEERFQNAMELLEALAAVPRDDSESLTPEQTVTLNFASIAKAQERLRPRGLSFKSTHSHQELGTESLHEEGSQSGSQKLRQLAQSGRQIPLANTVDRQSSAPTQWGFEEQDTQLPESHESARFRLAGIGLVALLAVLVLGFFFSKNREVSISSKPLNRAAAVPPTARIPIHNLPPKSVGLAVKTCSSGSVRACYPGPKGTKGKGVCKAGKQTCLRGKWGVCIGAVVPAKAEACNGVDDDCDGQIDEVSTSKSASCSRRHGDCVRRGILVCKNKRMICQFKALGKRGFVTLRMFPRRRSFSLRYKGKRRSFRGSTCLSIQKKTQVHVWAKGYQLCSFVAHPSSRTLRLSMKHTKGAGGLDDDAPNYCTKRR